MPFESILLAVDRSNGFHTAKTHSRRIRELGLSLLSEYLR